MNSYYTYNHTLTLDDLKKIIDDGLPIVAIINGEYYDIAAKRETHDK